MIDDTKTIIIALDLETTGLDPTEDAIIEIGAVKFDNSGILDEFQTLINPGRPVPPAITDLTGITSAMVRGAPPIEEVIDELKRFVGSHPILGHNISFDLSFLRNHDLFYENQAIDTYEMAAVLLPSAGRYNLEALGQAFQIPRRATHRALDDAQVTYGVFKKLYTQAAKLPLPVLREIVRLGKGLNWPGNWAFQRAFNYRYQEEQNGGAGKSSSLAYQNPLYETVPPEDIAPLDPVDPPQGLDTLEVSAILQPGGPFFDSFPEYEHRPEQVEMLRATAQAISEGRHLLIEAGTGIGKSLAYLIPSALWAIKNQRRVVISTNTINLQDQLISKDIPDLQAALDLDLRASVLKGRANYLCPHHVEILRKGGPRNNVEMRVLAKILVWLESSLSGDRGEINLNGPREERIWHRLSADNEDCSTENCLKRTGGRCPFYRARQAAHTSHLIIVNHALLLADVATGNRILPEYDTLIVDEAHHLESATTNALSFYASQANVRRALNALGDEKKGVLGWLLSYGKDVLTPADFGSLQTLIQTITNKTFKVESRMGEFFQAVDTFLEHQRGGEPIGRYTHQERILTSTRTQPDWTNVEIAWEQSRNALNGLLENLQQLWDGIREMILRAPEEEPQIESVLGDMREVYGELYELFENLDALVFDPDPNMIYWVEVSPDQRFISVQAAPLHIGELMEKHIWYEKRAVVLTSATLTTTGNFDYIRNRLKAIDAEEITLGSPFDYQTAALMYLVNDIPEPTDYRGHQAALNQGLIPLCKETGGRALVLFTSYAQLHNTANAITSPLAQEGIIVYEQGSGPSPHTLLKNFRESDQAVLLGTRAFWEGVDIPGQDLSVLVIAKLPFDVPSDPIVAARSETFQDPFSEYMLPEAILGFRQGFGRLIRSKQDLGIVVIMDRRVLTKTYGPLFLQSLPPCTIQEGPLRNVPAVAARWLNI
ncbi:MAG: helicase C-terminal domain-containing protein [Anaerolineales bacterium]